MKINEKLASLYMLLKDKENFLKYNQLCEQPFDLNELQKLQQILEDEDKGDLAKAMKTIFESLK